MNTYVRRRREPEHDINYIYICNIAYLKPRWIEILRIREEFRIVMNVPEQWHHLPTFWNEISCKNSRSNSEYIEEKELGKIHNHM